MVRHRTVLRVFNLHVSRFMATTVLVSLHRPLYTRPYVPSPICFSNVYGSFADSVVLVRFSIVRVTLFVAALLVLAVAVAWAVVVLLLLQLGTFEIRIFLRS